jgi:hypothetical protein
MLLFLYFLVWQIGAWRRVLDINLTACFLTTQIALPHMRQQGWGRIVNIASVQRLRICAAHARIAACRLLPISYFSHIFLYWCLLRFCALQSLCYLWANFHMKSTVSWIVCFKKKRISL